jgi:hypothetical protein
LHSIFARIAVEGNKPGLVSWQGSPLLPLSARNVSIIEMKMMIYLISVISFSFILSSCASKGTKTVEVPASNAVEKRTPDQVSEKENGAENVDFMGLQRSLGLERDPTYLGYVERPFNTCEVGYGYSKSHHCRQKYFVVIHFQLMCRDSEGTVSQVVRAADMQANSNRSVRWNLKDLAGHVSTDSEGYGQIAAVSGQSQKQNRLKLVVASDFLYLRAGEVQKIVTPRSWCR